MATAARPTDAGPDNSGFARSHGYCAVAVVNLFAYRARAPRDLRAAGYPVGPGNDAHIRSALAQAGGVCVAWGNCGAGHGRDAQVLQLVRAAGAVPMALGLTRSGSPRHPLMLPRTARLVPCAP